MNDIAAPSHIVIVNGTARGSVRTMKPHAAKVTAITRSELMPMSLAAVGFCAVARIALPSGVYRTNSVSATMVGTVTPTTITGDMHSINKANFAILHWFNLSLAPRFTNPQAQVKQLYCGGNAKDYENYLIQPAGQIDRELIVSEKANIDRIVATLAPDPLPPDERRETKARCRSASAARTSSSPWP